MAMFNPPHINRRFARRVGAFTISTFMFCLTFTAIQSSAHAYTSVAPDTAKRTLLINEDFTGAAGSRPNSDIWFPMTGGNGWGNNELQTYTTSTQNAQLAGNGTLQITARKQTVKGTDGIVRDWTSARLASHYSLQYGYFEARIALPQGQGLWPAFWTLGADLPTVGYPSSGEMDIMEAINSMPGVTGTLHGPNTVAKNVYGVSNSIAPTGGLGTSWHTYGIDWTPTSITWFLDGKSYATVTKASLPAGYTWEFSKPHCLLLNLAVGGTWPGSPNASTPSVATMQVDYVRVYSSLTAGVKTSITKAF